MLLAELLDYLKADSKLFSRVLGITPAGFGLLQAVFKNTKKAAKDRTTLLDESCKLLAAILIRRFNLNDASIRSFILPGQANAALQKSKTVILERLDLAFKKLPPMAEKIQFEKIPIVRSALCDRVYKTLDELIGVVNIAAGTKVLVTHKHRQNDPVWLESYGEKIVTEKKNSGQKNFLQLINCMLFDLDSCKDDYSKVILYMAVVMNFNLQNSTYRPQPGWGKTQTRGKDRPILYARSQSKHPTGSFYKKLTAKDQRLQCLQPKNEALYAVIAINSKNIFAQNLQKYDEKGYLKTSVQGNSKSMNYFSLPFAYSGLRRNSLYVTMDGLSKYFKKNNISDLISKISDDLDIPSTSEMAMVKTDIRIVKKRIAYVENILDELTRKMLAVSTVPNLYQKLTHYRNEIGRQISSLSSEKEFKNLDVAYNANSNCLNIKFYPRKIIEDSENYSLGVTNVIICFFVGLLNHQLATNNLFITVHRRQSFAFNRMTVADTTNMCMRVSIGYEPMSIVGVMINTLSILDELLSKYNFMNKNDKVLKQGFMVDENPRGKKPSEKTGNKFLKIMRSNRKMLKVSLLAEQLLNRNTSKDDYESHAFKEYIECIVTKQLSLDAKSIVIQKPLENKDIEVHKDNILVNGLLNNVLNYTLRKLAALKRNPVQESSLYSYCMIQTKLTKLCMKANWWLEKYIEFSESHVYAKTLLLIDDMLEYLIALDALCMSQASDVDQALAIKQFTETEKNYATEVLAIRSDKTEIFFTDNGQQALTASLVCLRQQITSKHINVHTFGDCYYELINDLRENHKLQSTTINTADFVYVDIRDAGSFELQLKNLKKAQIVVIDYTHNPNLESSTLKKIVHSLLNKGIFVVLAESMLKHEQLGIDKFQCGKIILLTPANKTLRPEILQNFTAISEASLHPLTASFFQMINEICGDKIKNSVSEISMFKRTSPSVESNDKVSPPSLQSMK